MSVDQSVFCTSQGLSRPAVGGLPPPSPSLLDDPWGQLGAQPGSLPASSSQLPPQVTGLQCSMQMH